VDAEIRLCIAYIAARAITRLNTSLVFDHASKKHRPIEGEVSDKKIHVFDHTRGSFITGRKAGRRAFSIYDDRTGQRFLLKLKRKNFTGYDFRTGKHYFGNIQGTAIRLYDCDGSEYHNYALSEPFLVESTGVESRTEQR
jgi:hypothetical protein